MVAPSGRYGHCDVTVGVTETFGNFLGWGVLAGGLRPRQILTTSAHCRVLSPQWGVCSWKIETLYGSAAGFRIFPIALGTNVPSRAATTVSSHLNQIVSVLCPEPSAPFPM